MKIHPRASKQFQVMDLFRAFAQEEGYSITDSNDVDVFFTKLSSNFEQAAQNPIFLHGFRVQTMFEYVASSLGKCAIIKTEDSGSVHTLDADLRVPDFRIVLTDKTQFLVEVKNFHQNSPLQNFLEREDYLEGLHKYARLMGLDVYFSIYWSRWNTWTLVPLTIFVYEGGKCSLRFEDAIRANHMASLGDFTLATIPPLRFRIHTQESKQRKVEKDGTGKFSIGGIEMLCVNKKIQNPLEQSIAFFLMLYGDWPSNLGEANIANGELIYFDFVSEPIEPSQEQPFQMIGTMSSIITRRFNSLTVREGEIDKFSPRSLESDLGITIPDDYEGEDLNLWRFVLEPGSKEAKP